MSFRNPFKAHHAPKKSAISRTAEREFEREVKKLEQLDDNTKKLYKDTKRCIEAQAAQSKQEVKLAQNLLTGPLCREDEELRKTSEQWLQSTKHLEYLSDELNGNSSKVMIEPMKKYMYLIHVVGAYRLGTLFPSLQQTVKKRDQSLQEYNKCQAKVDKYAEKERTGPNLVKLDQSKKALGPAKEEYEAQHNALMEDMPRLYEGRIDYIQPSFQALIKSQIRYYTEAHKTYDSLYKSLSGSKEDLVELDDGDDVSQRIQSKLAEIRALSITVDG